MSNAKHVAALLAVLALINVIALAVINGNISFRTFLVTIPPLLFAQTGLIALAAVLSDRRGWHRWAALAGLFVVLQLIWSILFGETDAGLVLVLGIYAMLIAAVGLFLRTLGTRWGDVPTAHLGDCRLRYSLRAILIATTVVACVAAAIRLVAAPNDLADVAKPAIVLFAGVTVTIFAAFAAGSMPGWVALATTLLIGGGIGYKTAFGLREPERDVFVIGYALYGGLIQTGFIVSTWWGWHLYGPRVKKRSVDELPVVDNLAADVEATAEATSDMPAD